MKQGGFFPQQSHELAWGSFKTTDDLLQIINQSMTVREGPTNITTHLSQKDHSKMLDRLSNFPGLPSRQVSVPGVRRPTVAPLHQVG